MSRKTTRKVLVTFLKKVNFHLGWTDSASLLKRLGKNKKNRKVA